MKSVLLAAMWMLSGVAVSDDTIDEERLARSDLRIDIGRLSTIQERTDEIWLKMRSDEYHGPRESAAELNSQLRWNVWYYNELRESLCFQRFIVEKSCGPPYVPKWVFETQNDAPSTKELQARYEDVSDHIVPFWEAACERLEKVISHDDWMPYCSIE